MAQKPDFNGWNIPVTPDRGKRRSELCKAADFHQSWYTRWCDELKEPPVYHRKQWEYVFILQALWERGCMQEGKRGLVFAAGSEPLPAVLAKYGCEILATDIEPERGLEKGWDNGNQLCFGLDSLYKNHLCDKAVFYNKVKYMPVDMNYIPTSLQDFDFNWSSCSFEHLGTIQLGLTFLKNQLKTLKPGGWAVHTTEYNLSSNDFTQENNPTVIFRHRDIAAIIKELEGEGHFVEELDYSMGSMPQDYTVDTIPHKQEIHLKLQIGDYVATSIGLIIQKKPA